MERYYNVHEVLNILRKHYVTYSLQMVTRFIRDGKLKAERSEYRKEGYRIKESDLYDFIDHHHEGLVPIMAFYEDAVDRLEVEYPRKKAPERIANEEIVDDIKDKADEPNEPVVTSVAKEEKQEVKKEEINEEIKEEIKELIKVNSNLDERIGRLIDILLNKYEQPETPTVENTQKEKKGTIKRRGEQHKKKSIDQFIKHIKKKISEQDRNDENLMKAVYAIYFDEKGKMHKSVYPEPEVFICPKTMHKVTEGKFIELLERAVPEIIKDIKENQQKENEISSNDNSPLSLSTEKI